MDAARRYGSNNNNSRPANYKPRLSAAKRGYDRNWRKIRLVILSANPLCVHCEKAGKIVPATDVDHIKPHVLGQPHDPKNLESLCKSCHSKKTARENGFSFKSST